MRFNEFSNTLYIGQSKIPGAGRGLFTAKPINSGDFFVLDPVITITDKDWIKIKDTKFVRMMGLQWTGREHVIPVGKIQYTLSPEDKKAFDSTDRFRSGLFISAFLLANHSEKPNAEEVIDVTNRVVGLKALRFIEPGEEITKRYKNTPPVRSKSLDFNN